MEVENLNNFKLDWIGFLFINDEVSMLNKI